MLHCLVMVARLLVAGIHPLVCIHWKESASCAYREGAESLSWKGNESHYTVLENWQDTK